MPIDYEFYGFKQAFFFLKERLYDDIKLLSWFSIHNLVLDLDGKKTASVLDGFFQSPVCLLRPSLFICSKQVPVPSIASLLVKNVEAPSSTYIHKKSSSLVRDHFLSCDWLIGLYLKKH